MMTGNIITVWTLMIISNRYYIPGHYGRKNDHSFDLMII